LQDKVSLNWMELLLGTSSMGWLSDLSLCEGTSGRFQTEQGVLHNPSYNDHQFYANFNKNIAEFHLWRSRGL